MKRPSFFYGTGVALGIAIASGAVFATLAPTLGADAALRLVVPAMGLAYMFCLLRRSEESTGRITAVAGWCVISAITWFLGPPLPAYVLVHAGMLWLVRSLYFHSGVFPALLDLGLSALSVSAATWAITRSGSVFLGSWCFFLVQALFVFIPRSVASPAAGRDPGNDDDSFERARRRADAALKQLATH